MFKKDSYLLGSLLAFLIPAVLSALLVLFESLQQSAGNPGFHINKEWFLACIIPNLLLIRYFLINRSMEKSGRAMIAVSMILIFLFFIFLA